MKLLTVIAALSISLCGCAEYEARQAQARLEQQQRQAELEDILARNPKVRAAVIECQLYAQQVYNANSGRSVLDLEAIGQRNMAYQGCLRMKQAQFQAEGD